MSSKASPKPDPNRKSFWQYQGIKYESTGGPEPDKRPVAVFRHAVTRYGETFLSRDIAYPNTRTYTLEQLEAIENKPMKFYRELKNDTDRAMFEKHRRVVNLARAGLTSVEFNRAVEGLRAEQSRPEIIAAGPTARELNAA